MKKLLVGTVVLVSISAYGADLNGFVVPTSLGQNINVMNKQFKLGLKKYDGNQYYIAVKKHCGLTVTTNQKDTINSIELHGEGCPFSTKTPIVYQYGKTNSTGIFNQVKLSEMHIVPGCFNCLYELGDEIIIEKPNQKYRTIITIDGHNSAYHIALSKLLFNAYDEDNHYEYMKKLDEQDRKIFKRDDVKKLALKHYQKVGSWGYRLELK